MLDRGRLGTFVLGTVAGILTGVFIAPRSGRELRNALANRAGEVRERSREGYFETRERMRERFASPLPHETGVRGAGEGERRLPDETELYERVRRTQELIRSRLRQEGADRNGRGR